jgi:hypothetical protein
MAAPARDRKSLLTFEHCQIPFHSVFTRGVAADRALAAIDDGTVSANIIGHPLSRKNRAHSLDLPEGYAHHLRLNWRIPSSGGSTASQCARSRGATMSTTAP